MHCAPYFAEASQITSRVGDGRGVEADLVGARVEQAPHVLDRAHAAADRERDEDLRGHRLDDVQDQVAAVAGRGDVEEGELVGALLVVARGDLDRVAGVAQLDEVDALDDAAGGDVEAGNDAFGEHVGVGLQAPRVQLAELVGLGLRLRRSRASPA